ncbi:MAG: hypothetical protein BroJett021_13920 [Chloroflexota bacterium]|nr:hypothetical protein [Caldilinea sp.]GIK72404.1 MAG: hypothetical protein BroJett021_13920 [Chloroflexota bacterium]
MCIQRNTKAIAFFLIFMSMALNACTRAPGYMHFATPAPSIAAVAFGDTPIEIALSALIIEERTAARERDLTTLAQLWAHDARIVDSRGTDDPAAAYVWQGRDAILDRYVLAVFPAPPPPLTEPLDLVVEQQGNSATATLNNDRWRFTFAEGRWWLQELSY